MIRVAILGTGAIADTHIQALLQFPSCAQIVALMNPHLDKAQEKITRYNLDARAYTSVETLLNDTAFDLGIICAPPFAHAPLALDLLKAGKHVLVEKPMATCLAECDEMINAAQTHQRLLSVVAQNRFRTPIVKLKRLVESGIIGKIVFAQVDSFWWRGSHYYDLWWRGTWEKEGGGCVLNHAVHHIDLFHWIVGMPQAVQATLANLAHDNSQVEDFATATLFYPNGSIGQVNVSLVHHGEPQQLVVQGERARIGFPWQVYASRQRENGFPERDDKLEQEIQARYDQWPNLSHELHVGQIANVLAAIEGREELWVDGVAGRRTMELVTAIYASGFSGTRVALPLSSDHPLYTREGILKHAPHFREKTYSIERFADNTIIVGASSDQKA